jgi:iron uptake system component EfeO
VKSQVQELIPAVAKLTAAYEAGDDATARSLFAGARVSYERIEPTAEQFGDLDPKIDYREVDAVAENLSWTGFHRIEKDLWPPAAGALNADGTSATLNWAPSTPAERKTYGDGLVANVQQLSDLVNKAGFTVSLSDISNGAIGLLDEVATSKITGEEDWWSHTDLSDFQANVQGAEVAFGNVKSIAASKGAAGTKLVASIQKEFTAMDALLSQYGSLQAGYTSYDQVTNAQRKALSDQVNALAEPLSQLTHTVLGVPAS